MQKQHARRSVDGLGTASVNGHKDRGPDSFNTAAGTNTWVAYPILMADPAGANGTDLALSGTNQACGERRIKEWA